MSEKKIEIGGRLHSIATGNVLAGANEIFDDDKNKKQSDINTETYTLVNDVNERLNGLSPDQQSALTVAAKATNNETKLGYYVCGTEGNVAAKVISDATGYILSKGGSMKVKMTNANTVANATLNINSTGAKPLYYDGERASVNNSWEAGETVEVYYDGTNYYANNVAGGSGSGDGAFDISAKTGQNYETLSAALTAANSILPASKKKGGMSIKFIQLTPATYSVVKTEGLTEQPTGTEVQEALTITDGTYTAAQLPVEAPATTATYWLSVTETVEDVETTTYTTWVITKVTADKTEYVQKRYMSSSTAVADFTNVANWQGVDSEPVAGSRNLVESGGVEKLNHPYIDPVTIQTGEELTTIGTKSSTKVTITKDGGEFTIVKTVTESTGGLGYYIGLLDYDYTKQHYLYVDYEYTKKGSPIANIDVRIGNTGTDDTICARYQMEVGAHSAKIALSKTLQGKYITCNFNSLGSNGTTIVLRNIRIVKEDDITIREKFDEVDSSLENVESTLAETKNDTDTALGIAKTLDLIAERREWEALTMYNNYNFKLNINENTCVVEENSTQNSTSINYMPVKQGEIFKFRFVSSSKLILCLFNEPPISNGIVGEVIADIQGSSNSWKDVELKMPTDGYLGCYISIATTTGLEKYKLREEGMDEDLYTSKVLNISYVISSCIDVDPNSQYFGQSRSVSGNQYRTSNFIDIVGVKYLKLFSRKSAAAFTSVYKNDSFGTLFYDEEKQPIAWSGVPVEVYLNTSISTRNQGYRIIPIPQNAAFVKITDYTSAPSTFTIYKEKLKDNIVGLENEIQQLGAEVASIKDYKKYIKQARWVAETPDVSSLGLLHFTDIHGDDTAVNQMLSWLSEYSSYINDIINSGDVVYGYLSDTTNPVEWWRNTGLAHKSLFVLGNHDQAYSSDANKRLTYFWADCGENGDGNIDTTIAKSEAIKSSHIYCWNKYFADYISEWGVTPPTGYDDPSSPYYQACYWHKDYASRKIRLIGLDCIFRFDGILAKDGNDEFIIDSETGMLAVAENLGNYAKGLAKLTTEQETWLYNKLNETLDSNNQAYGYSVLVMAHYPLDDCEGFNVLGNIGTDNRGWSNISQDGGIILNHRTGDTVNFHNGSNSPIESDQILNIRNRDSRSGTYGYVKGEVNNFGDIIKNWQDKGGKFVAWICGHNHSDRFYYPKKYPNMLCVVLDQAGSLRAHNGAYREQGDYTNNCANYYSIDTQNGLFKIIRFGLNSNRLLAAKNYLCYDYKNKIVVNEG